MRKSNRGAALIDDLIVIALVGLVLAASKPSGATGKNHWWEFWKKNPIEQVSKSQAELDAEKKKRDEEIAAAVAKQKAENDKQLNSAHEASVATVAAVAAAQQKTTTGILPVKELETAEKTAKLTKEALDEATGNTVSPARIRELETMVSNLNSGIAAGADALKSMQSALDISVANEKKLEVEVKRVTETANARVTVAETKLGETTVKLGEFATERDAIARKYENIRFWVIVGVGGVFLLWLGATFLPIIAKAFPSFEPLAHTLGTFWAPGVQVVKNASTKLNEDFVAMTEMLKTELAKKSTPEEMEALKKKISNEWMTVQDGTAQTVDALKAKLRL